MRTNNKMKDFEVKYKEWWEVTEYFTKELEKKLTQHKTDEIFLRYKLEAHQKNFLDFICGSPTSIKASGQDEAIEIELSETTHEEKVQTK